MNDVCESGHKFKEFLAKIAVKMFNIMSVNFISEANSGIHQSKRRTIVQNPKKDEIARKICKLTSN